MNGRGLREQSQDRGVVAIGQQTCGTPSTRLEADETGGRRTGVRQRHCHLAGGGQGFRYIGERSGFEQRMRRQPVILGGPGHVAHRQAIAISGHKSQRLPIDLHLHARQQRKRLVPRGRYRDLADCPGQVVGIDCAGHCGHGRQVRVVISGHSGQGEVRSTA